MCDLEVNHCGVNWGMGRKQKSSFTGKDTSVDDELQELNAERLAKPGGAETVRRDIEAELEAKAKRKRAHEGTTSSAWKKG